MPSTLPAPATAGRAWSPTPTSRAPIPRSTRTCPADEAGLATLFRQFSFPGGIPSHVAPETPGSIHEGGELGYSLVHAYGAVFDNPDLVAVCVVGDGEAETGPLADELALEQVPQSAQRRRGAADPPPERLQDRESHRARPHPRGGARRALPRIRLRAAPRLGGSTRAGRACTSASRPPSTRRSTGSRAIQRAAREHGTTARPRWPMLVLRTPKGWTGPEEVDGLPVEGTWRSHQVPLAEVRRTPTTSGMLEEWLKSYRPEELFDDDGHAGARARRARPRTASGG